MKIYYICAVDLANYDAQRTHILEVVSVMDSAGEDVTLFIPEFHNGYGEQFSFNCSYIPTFIKKSKLKFIEYEFRLLFVLAKRCLFNRPDIIYIRKSFFSIVPVVLSRLYKIKSIVEVNGIIADDLKVSFGLPNSMVWLFALIEKFVYSVADRVVVVTAGLKSVLNDVYGIDKEKIDVVNNGVNTELFIPKGVVKSDTFYLGFVGHLVEWAGVEFLIRSIPGVVAKKSEVKYLIVGDGHLMGPLKRLAESLNVLDYIEFAGEVKPSEVVDHINRCEICFIPAVRERNEKIGISPLKLYEYLACGKPVIVSDIKGLDVAAEFNVGLVVTPENPQELEKATLDLISDDAKREAMGQRGRRLAEERFSWKGVTDRLLEICKRLIKE